MSQNSSSNHWSVSGGLFSNSARSSMAWLALTTLSLALVLENWKGFSNRFSKLTDGLINLLGAAFYRSPIKTAVSANLYSHILLASSQHCSNLWGGL